jgi:hypothetical protein
MTASVFELRRVERGERAVVLEQRDVLRRRFRASSRCSSQPTMRSAASGIDIRVVEQPKRNLAASIGATNSSSSASVSVPSRTSSTRWCSIGLGQLDVDARPHGERCCLAACRRRRGDRKVRPLDQLADRVVVRNHKALEAPLLRSTSRSSQRLACDGTPSISLYEAITLIAPASWIAFLKGGKNDLAQDTL